MLKQDPQLEIASRVLSGIIAQDRNRKLLDRIDDIRHSLEVAAELIRQRDGGQSPDYDLTPRLAPGPRTMERKIERDEGLSFSERRAARTPSDEVRRPKGPTLH